MCELLFELLCTGRGQRWLYFLESLVLAEEISKGVLAENFLIGHVGEALQFLKGGVVRCVGLGELAEEVVDEQQDLVLANHVCVVKVDVLKQLTGLLSGYLVKTEDSEAMLTKPFFPRKVEALYLLF